MKSTRCDDRTLRPGVNRRDADPVRREYDRLAAEYDRRWSFYIRATTRETLKRMNLKDADRLLDVGCGTGALLEALHRSNPRNKLAGVDISEAMIAVARAKLPSSFALKVGSAESIPFNDVSFDVVVSCNAFHYFRRPEAALQEMIRVLNPGGRVIITDWCDDYLACRICDFFLRRFNRAHYRTYGSRECGRMLEEAPFRSVRVERFRINWLWGLMTATGETDRCRNARAER